MVTSNGPPTPKGVGGPTPPLVSRGSEEEWEMKIPTAGSPSGGGEGGPTAPPTPEGGMAPSPEGGRGGLTLNRENDDEPLPTQIGAADHPLTQGGGNEPPPTRKGRGQNEGRETDSHQNRPEKSARRTHTSRELRCAPCVWCHCSHMRFVSSNARGKWGFQCHWTR